MAVRLNATRGASMKIGTIASMTVLGGTVASSLLLSPLPTHQAAATIAPLVTASLPYTGPATAIRRMKHENQLEAPLTPTEIYEQYVPPPPPDPTPAPAVAAAPRGWVAPAGY